MSGRNLIVNASAGLAAQVGTMLLSLAALPYIVHKLGQDAYAIFAMVITVSGYLGILQMGLGRAIVRFVAADHARDDLAAINRHVGTALAVYLVAGAIGAVALGSIAGLLVERLFNVPPELRQPGRLTFLIAAAGMLVQFPLNILMTIPTAVQMTRVTSLLRAGVRAVTLLAAVGLLAIGRGLIEMVCAQVLVNLAAILVSALILKRLVPGLGLRTMRIEVDFVRPLLKESFLVSWGSAMAVLTMQLDRFLLGVFLPIGAIAPYIICQALASKVWTIPTHILEAVYPAMSAKHALGETQAVRNLYIRASRAVVLAVAPMAFAIMYCAYQILAVWMGVEIADVATLTLRLLAAAALISAFGWAAVSAAQSTGQPQIPARVQTAQAVINTLACVLLIPRYGFDGAALAWVVNHLVGIPILITIVHRQVLAVPARDWLWQSLCKPILVSSLPLLLLLPLREQFTSMPRLVIGLTLVYGLSVIASYRLALDATDRRAISGLIREAVARASHRSGQAGERLQKAA